MATERRALRGLKDRSPHSVSAREELFSTRVPSQELLISKETKRKRARGARRMREGEGSRQENQTREEAGGGGGKGGKASASFFPSSTAAFPKESWRAAIATEWTELGRAGAPRSRA